MAPDFQRPVHAVLGLPFDAVDASRAEALLRAAVSEQRRCFLSTPNLNFAVACLDDAAFRDSVLQSDLCVADGWPVVAIARLLGSGPRFRVTGSGLFECLRASPLRPPMRVFFFGGPPGAAEAACKALNAEADGACCVGFDAAGFGNTEQMSSAPTLSRINASGADFVVVALGARKGQAWISRNRALLEAPLVSHLGAVVNFVAGTVRRAPQWVQQCRLEWLWRIAQEPALLGRYVADGRALVRVLWRDVLPLAWHLRRHAPAAQELEAATITIEQEGERARLLLRGAWTAANLLPRRAALQRLVAAGHSVAVDLSAASHLDTAALGLLMLLHGWNREQGFNWTVERVSPQLRVAFAHAHADYLLQPQA